MFSEVHSADVVACIRNEGRALASSVNHIDHGYVGDTAQRQIRVPLCPRPVTLAESHAEASAYADAIVSHTTAYY